MPQSAIFFFIFFAVAFLVVARLLYYGFLFAIFDPFERIGKQAKQKTKEVYKKTIFIKMEFVKPSKD